MPARGSLSRPRQGRPSRLNALSTKLPEFSELSADKIAAVAPGNFGMLPDTL
jgi:hypothetical protein